RDNMVYDDITLLVDRARRGDRAAMGTLCERFTPMVFATAMARLRNSAEAEEVVQETFLCCVRKLRQLDDDARFAGWLRRIAARTSPGVGCAARWRMACGRSESARRPPVCRTELIPF